MQTVKSIKRITDESWDKKGTLKDYILDSYCEGKRLSLIFKRVQKKYPNYFGNEAEMLRWIEDNLERES